MQLHEIAFSTHRTRPEGLKSRLLLPLSHLSFLIFLPPFGLILYHRKNFCFCICKSSCAKIPTPLLSLILITGSALCHSPAMDRGKFVQLVIPEGEVLPNGKALPPPAPPEILNSEVLYKQIEGESDVSPSFTPSILPLSLRRLHQCLLVPLSILYRTSWPPKSH